MSISKERLAALEAMRDKDIDLSDIPEVDDAFFRTAKLVMPASTPKKAISMRVDEDVPD